jgi:flavin prenyltransferase
MIHPSKQTVALAITGASGVIYGIRLLEELLRRHAFVHLTISPNAKAIAKLEMGIHINLDTGQIEGLNEEMDQRVMYHHYSHVGAAPASGSYPFLGVAVVPCSMGTLGRLANGISDSLIGRMADVALKEKRPLVLVPRETPYNLIQLRNMQTLCEAGATLMPASPGFYHNPQSIHDLVNFMVSRILQHLGFDAQDLVKGGWGEINSQATKIRLEDPD